MIYPSANKLQGRKTEDLIDITDSFVTENFLGGQYTEQVICQDVTEYFKL